MNPMNREETAVNELWRSGPATECPLHLADNRDPAHHGNLAQTWPKPGIWRNIDSMNPMNREETAATAFCGAPIQLRLDLVAVVKPDRTDAYLPGQLRNGNRSGDPATAPRCGAKTRAGSPCQCPAIRGRRRCRLHGGLSRGPTTEHGRERSRHARLLHGGYTPGARLEARERRHALREGLKALKQMTASVDAERRRRQRAKDRAFEWELVAEARDCGMFVEPDQPGLWAFLHHQSIRRSRSRPTPRRTR